MPSPFGDKAYERGQKRKPSPLDNVKILPYNLKGGEGGGEAGG